MSGRPRALVLGAAGQDGSYACEQLHAAGYRVVGAVRRDPGGPLPNLEPVRANIDLVCLDLDDTTALVGVLERWQPDEVYNFASVSFGPDAWADPVRTSELGTVALVRLVETLRTTVPAARFFHASSAWVFGCPAAMPQNEDTPFAPVEPYGAAKAFGNFLLRAYRERYGLHYCSGIFFTHESPRRPEKFVVRKVTRAVARIKLGLADSVVLGGLDSRRDWGYAPDYVRAARLMLQADDPRDYVVATGISHSVRELLDLAFGAVELDWLAHVRSDPAFNRPGGGNPDGLVGDSSRLRSELGWAPSLDFAELVRSMVLADIADLEAGAGAGGEQG